MKKILVLVLIFTLVFSLTSCERGMNKLKDIPSEKSVEYIINTMTLEEKVWQMFFVSPEDILDNISVAIQAGETTKKALEDYPVGGLIYFSQNIETRDQLVKMIKNTKEYCKIAPFIAIDEEGGRVSRLGNANIGTTMHPPMGEIGATENPENAKKVGETLANELLSLGFNMDFAPVTDVITVDGNEDIGDRSFGTDPTLVANMVSAQVKGMQDNGLIATLKHFPSNGSTVSNTHKEAGICTRTLDEMRNTEFIPFKAGIEAGADVIMIAHMTAAELDDVPSTISKTVVTDVLRNELNFAGVIVSDALNMGAITSSYSPEEVAILAVNAGVDLLLMSPDVKSAANAIIQKVHNGEISQRRIDESVTRILLLKKKRGII